jgi:hypothetical protein
MHMTISLEVLATVSGGTKAPAMPPHADEIPDIWQDGAIFRRIPRPTRPAPRPHR